MVFPVVRPAFFKQNLKLKNVMRKIDYELTREGNKVTFKILWQDPRFFCRGWTEDTCSFHSTKENFYVHSSAQPELGSRSVYLLGCSKIASEYASNTFPSPELAEAYIAQVRAAIADWEKNAPEFAEDKLLDSRLDALLKVEGNELVFKVFSQDPRFCSREGLSKCPEFHAANGWEIRSAVFVGISGNIIWLLGEGTVNREDRETFSSPEAAEAARLEILAALREWAEKAPEFQDEKVPGIHKENAEYTWTEPTPTVGYAPKSSDPDCHVLKHKDTVLLEYRLWREGCMVHFQIRQQFELLINEEPLCRARFDASNGISVESAGGPELSATNIFLRGDNKEQDNKIDWLFFSASDDAASFVERANTALSEWAAHVVKIIAEHEAEKAPEFQEDAAVPTPIFGYAPPASPPAKLKFRLEKFERAIAFQILEQDSRFLSTLSDDGYEFEASNGFEVCSDSAPALSEHIVWLRGYEPENNWEVASLEFDSNIERDIYVARLVAALKEWAAKAPEFQDPVIPLETADEPGVFTLR